MPQPRYSLTRLRDNLFKAVDELIKTGVPIEINRKGHKVKMILEEPPKKLDNLKAHADVYLDDPESYVHTDWSKHWNKDQPE